MRLIFKVISDQLKKYSEEEIQKLLETSENPVALSYTSMITNQIITIPIWTYFYDKKFYCFASRKSKKVQAIEAGNTHISLLIINQQYFPHPESHTIPYLGIRGSANICFHSNNPKIAWIHQKLLLKYDSNLSQGWIKELYNKIESRPEEDWLIEIIPKSYYSY